MTIEKQLDILQYEFMPLWIELKILTKFYGCSDVKLFFDLGNTREECNLKRWQFSQMRVLTIKYLSEIKYFKQ